jgi:hypothetical protein
MSDLAPTADGPRAVRAHRRFSLRDVTLAGVPVGGATVDAWHDPERGPEWCARLLLKASAHARHGWLEGTMQDGRRVGGPVRLQEVQDGPRRGREVLASLFGDGPLVDTADLTPETT